MLFSSCFSLLLLFSGVYSQLRWLLLLLVLFFRVLFLRHSFRYIGGNQFYCPRQPDRVMTFDNNRITIMLSNFLFDIWYYCLLFLSVFNVQYFLLMVEELIGRIKKSKKSKSIFCPAYFPQVSFSFCVFCCCCCHCWSIDFVMHFMPLHQHLSVHLNGLFVWFIITQRVAFIASFTGTPNGVFAIFIGKKLVLFVCLWDNHRTIVNCKFSEFNVIRAYHIYR